MLITVILALLASTLSIISVSVLVLLNSILTVQVPFTFFVELVLLVVTPAVVPLFVNNVHLAHICSHRALQLYVLLIMVAVQGFIPNNLPRLALHAILAVILAQIVLLVMLALMDIF